MTDNQPPADLQAPAADASDSVTTTEHDQAAAPDSAVDRPSFDAPEADPADGDPRADETAEDAATAEDAGLDALPGEAPAGDDVDGDEARAGATESESPDEPAPVVAADKQLELGEVEVVIDDDTMRRALEAILMVSDEPLPVLTLARTVGRATGDVAAALAALAEEYTEQRRGFDLREVGGGWRYYTREDAAQYVERFVLDGQQARLTQAALETLAVVAYKQPVSRARVSAIRGVNVDGVMRTLISRGLVEEAGADTESQALLYRTTSYFLERMGMQSLDDLPELAPYLPEMDDMEEELAAQAAAAAETETAAADPVAETDDTEVPDADATPDAGEAITSDVGAAAADPEIVSAAAEAVDAAEGEVPVAERDELAPAEGDLTVAEPDELAPAEDLEAAADVDLKQEQDFELEHEAGLAEIPAGDDEQPAEEQDKNGTDD